MNTKIIPLGIVACLSVAHPLSAAVTTITGGASSGYEYFDRKYDNSGTSNDDDDYSRFRVSPFITIVSETARQSVDFTYAPSFWYDLDSSEDDLDHNLSLEYMRMLTRYWNVSLADNLSVTDEFNSYTPTIDPETGVIISEGPGNDTADLPVVLKEYPHFIRCASGHCHLKLRCFLLGRDKRRQRFRNVPEGCKCQKSTDYDSEPQQVAGPVLV